MQSDPTTPAGDQVPVYDRSRPGSRWRDRFVAGVICLVVGAGAGFAVGRASAPGPKTLAEALQQAQQGKLPRGDLQGARGGLLGGGQGNQNGQNGQSNQQGGPGRPGGLGGGSLQADITAISGDVVTLSTPAGELKIRLTGSTQVRRAVSGKRADLGVGDTVSVRLDPGGSNGSDGTVAASSITEEPAQ